MTPDDIRWLADGHIGVVTPELLRALADVVEAARLLNKPRNSPQWLFLQEALARVETING